MKSQWIIVCGLGLAFLTAIVAVFNTDAVLLDYIAGEARVSLIIVISASVLVGGLIVTLFGMVRPYQMQKEKEKLEANNKELRTENEDLKERLSDAHGAYSMLKKEKEERKNGMSRENDPPNGQSNHPYSESNKSRLS
jgi:putative membrane protein